MYTEKDYQQTKKQVILRACALLAIVAATATGCGLCIARRIDWANLLIAVVGSLCAASYFSLYFFPWFKYSRYLSDIRSGRSHECDATFLSVSDQTTLRDGVAMHDVEVCVGDDPEVIEDHRLFFWDDDKPFPALKAGTPVRVRAFGNYIIGLSER